MTTVAMLLYPALTQLDLTGPFEVLSRMPDSVVHLVAKDHAPVRADSGLTIGPTRTLAEVDAADVLFVPGGPGQRALMDDDAVLSFLTRVGASARWITSVCTGSLVLGAAGLLRGRRATTHWAYRELLPLFGAHPEDARVVVDGNRITAGGVTAGIDFGLRLVAELAGERVAKAIQLALEYDPEPPFQSGRPEHAGKELVDALVSTRFGARVAEQRAAILARGAA